MAQSKMRSLGDKAYAKAWSAKKLADNAYQCRLTISRKNENKTEDYPDDYITDFSGYVTLRNEAAKKIASLGLPEFVKKGDSSKPANIQLASAVSVRGGSFSNKELNEYKQILAICDKAKDGKVSSDDMDKVIKYIKARAGRYSFTVWDINLDDSDGGAVSKKASAKKDISVDDDEDDLPF